MEKQHTNEYLNDAHPPNDHTGPTLSENDSPSFMQEYIHSGPGTGYQLIEPLQDTGLGPLPVPVPFPTYEAKAVQNKIPRISTEIASHFINSEVQVGHQSEPDALKPLGIFRNENQKDFEHDYDNHQDGNSWAQQRVQERNAAPITQFVTPKELRISDGIEERYDNNGDINDGSNRPMATLPPIDVNLEYMRVREALKRHRRRRRERLKLNLHIRRADLSNYSGSESRSSGGRGYGAKRQNGSASSDIVSHTEGSIRGRATIGSSEKSASKSTISDAFSDSSNTFERLGSVVRVTGGNSKEDILRDTLLWLDSKYRSEEYFLPVFEHSDPLNGLEFDEFDEFDDATLEIS